MSKHMFSAGLAMPLARSGTAPAAAPGPGDGGARPGRAQEIEALRAVLDRLEARHAAPGTDPGAHGGADADRIRPVLPLGDLDAHLPGGGLPVGVLNEITAEYAHRPAAYGFTFALMAKAQKARSGPAILVLSRRALCDFGHPYGHGLSQLGLDVSELILVEANKDDDALWAIEEALRAHGCAAIVAGAIAGSVDLTQARRLNLAAQATGTPLALLRAGKADAGPAATRWRITTAPAAKDRGGAFHRWRWQASLERCRNGRPGHWLIEWDHVAHRFHLVESLAHRAPVAQPGGRSGAGAAAGVGARAGPASLRRTG
ncbi:MAG: ImuA protein [Hyphomicrobiaceae bacterium]|nr:ImuA protein [Hyphomicrobiaceae bacterium]